MLRPYSKLVRLVGAAALVGLRAVGAFNGLDVADTHPDGRDGCGADEEKQYEAAAACGTGARLDWGLCGVCGIRAGEFDAIGFSFRDHFGVIEIDNLEGAAACVNFERACVEDGDFTEGRHRRGGADQGALRGNEKILVWRK